MFCKAYLTFMEGVLSVRGKAVISFLAYESLHSDPLKLCSVLLWWHH